MCIRAVRNLQRRSALMNRAILSAFDSDIYVNSGTSITKLRFPCREEKSAHAKRNVERRHGSPAAWESCEIDAGYRGEPSLSASSFAALFFFSRLDPDSAARVPLLASDWASRGIPQIPHSNLPDSHLSQQHC